MKKRRIVLWMVVAYTAAAWIITMVVNVSLCRDIRGYWWVDPKMVDEHCVPSSVLVLWLVTWTVHFSSDIMRESLTSPGVHHPSSCLTVSYSLLSSILSLVQVKAEENCEVRRLRYILTSCYQPDHWVGAILDRPDRDGQWLHEPTNDR